MESNEIEPLLERYWAGETSLDEEACLRDWFAKGDIPEHLRCYRHWFDYLKEEQAVHLGDDFDARILSVIDKPVVRARRMSLIARFMPLLKAAAVVALFVCLGNVMQRPFWSDSVEVVAIDTIGKLITTPSVALSVDVAVQKDNHLIDSLQRVMQQEKE